MDIASVYLNLASLLGTEIEVEGYYEWGAIRSLEKDRHSLSLLLPRYVWDQGLTDINHALDLRPWIKFTVKGCLRLNRQGEPLLDPLQSIIYKTDDIAYRAIFIYDENSITCDMCGDLIYNHSSDLTNYITFKNPFFAYKSISKPILLEGTLKPPYGINSKFVNRFSVVLNTIVLDYVDLARQTIWLLFYLFVGVPLILIMNVKNIRLAIRIIWDARPIYQSFIWIKDQEITLLNRYLGPSIPGGYKRWDGKVRFLFAGQITKLDPEEKKMHNLPNDYNLTFDSLDFIRVSRTITFKRPQDE
jgi:hypothetical protein